MDLLKQKKKDWGIYLILWCVYLSLGSQTPYWRAQKASPSPHSKSLTRWLLNLPPSRHTNQLTFLELFIVSHILCLLLRYFCDGYMETGSKKSDQFPLKIRMVLWLGMVLPVNPKGLSTGEIVFSWILFQIYAVLYTLRLIGLCALLVYLYGVMSL